MSLKNTAGLMQTAEGLKIPMWQRMRTKMLLLIAFAIFITKVLVYIPYIASQRSHWLEDRFHEAKTLSLVVLNAENDVQSSDIRNAVLKYIHDHVHASVITLIKDGERYELTSTLHPDRVDEVVNAQHFNETTEILDSFRTLFSSKPRIIKVIGPTEKNDVMLEVIISNAGLHESMLKFTWYFLFISLTISIIAATLIYAVTQWLLIRPLQDIYRNMIGFVLEPDNPSRIMVPEKRSDELGITQRRISALETELQQSYVRQKHLASLGLAVSKINHDMRNILASAQLMSDHLVEVKDPVVQKLAPKLIRAIDRATHYSQSVVAYGRAQEDMPERRNFKLHYLINDVHDSLLLEGSEKIEFQNFVPENFELNADPNQLYRVISNLMRNAMQAMIADKSNNCSKKCIIITAKKLKAISTIDIEDNGPGLPEKAKEHLFSPFQGSTSRGGTGLGLAICEELIRAHGGTISVLDDGKPGTHFEICLPDGPALLTQ